MKPNFIHGYVTLDEVTFTEADWEQFNQIKKTYFIEFEELNTKNGRTLYYLVMRDRNLLTDSIDEENPRYGILTLFTPRNPEIIGIWEIDGTPMGQTKKVTPATYNERTGEIITEEIVEYIGTPIYPFNKVLYENHIEPRIQTDEDGKEISRETFYDVRCFSGFGKKKDF